MRVSHTFTWKEFKEFREQEGMPNLGKKVLVGSKEGYINTTIDQLNIEESARLEYLFVLIGNKLKDCVFLKNGLRFEIEVEVSEQEKDIFLHKWFELKKIKNWGMANGKSEEMTVDNVGWRLVEDICNHVFGLLKKEENLKHGAGRHDYYMSQSFSYDIDGPQLHVYFLSGGIYFTKIEGIDRESNFRIILGQELMSEEEERKQIERLSEIEAGIHSFLKKHKVVIDPMKGVIPLN